MPLPPPISIMLSQAPKSYAAAIAGACIAERLVIALSKMLASSGCCCMYSQSLLPKSLALERRFFTGELIFTISLSEESFTASKRANQVPGAAWHGHRASGAFRCPGLSVEATHNISREAWTAAVERAAVDDADHCAHKSIVASCLRRVAARLRTRADH